MSIDPEDILEEALRSDFPTPDAETRVRRRLVAAGVAVGNGIAANTAAASGASASVAAKVAGLSWGLKVGVAALLGIPAVGLWLDGRGERAPAPPTAAPVRASELTPQPPALTLLTRDQPSPVTEPTAPPALAPERLQPRTAKSAAPEAPAQSPPTPGSVHPSQAAFGTPEQPVRSAQAPSSLAEETRLLDAAFAALAADNRAQAAALLREHERRFPAGLLLQERERAKTRLSEMSRGE